ncbi:MAG TPA: selenocysteine-specific translation elongation factor [Gemmatimonadales bacterium]|nr:selenocysteine-specific translation elongation factor [Gemmatimonadales bacterium]
MIIGTAGHIDHGKSALIEALTGVRMDRLREERERGITIDLNFAPLVLGDGRVAGVVDVPGHEDFVRTMVAGASGMDLVLLVIAADEGIKPQTREHLAIVEQLGIPRGIPVLTKTDLVEPEWLELVSTEIAEWLSASPVRFNAPVPVSAIQGTGLDRLKQEIRQIGTDVAGRPLDDLFRLPVDRAFSVAGIGTVVTGTAWSGSVAVGEIIRIMPGGTEARVRSIEVHGKPAERSLPGMRVALGLVGVDRDQMRRGDVVVTHGSPWQPTGALDVELHLLPEAARALMTRSRVRIHLGTTEVLARVYPREKIEPGRSGLARLALESPTIARSGDRFVLRSYSPVLTIGGGTVLDPIPPRRGSWSPGLVRPEPEQRLRAVLERRPLGVSERELPLLSPSPPAAVLNTMKSWAGYRSVQGYFIPESAILEAAMRAAAAVARFHSAHPGERGMPLGELRQSLRSPGWLTDAVLEQLASKAEILLDEGFARAPGFKPRLNGGEAQVDRIVARLELAQLAPPNNEELARELGLSEVSNPLRLAAQSGVVEAVERDRYFARTALDRFTAELRALGRAGPITPALVRDRLGITRKYVIPLLEWADRKGITVRVGDGRRLKEVPLPPRKP